MDERLNTDNWAEVFGEASGFGTAADNALSPVPAPIGSSVSTSPFTREDVAAILHIHEDDGDYAEWIGWCVVRLRDGRFAVLQGGCDTSGWG